MCGFTGVSVFNSEYNFLLNKVNNSNYKLKHRGPDGQKCTIYNSVALGHARLSIIDVSEHGTQPMTDATGNFTIIFNGEIFNYKKLKIQLEQKGCQFESNSDTEVLLYLFIEKGADCLADLDGEFSFCIYNKSKNELFIARDRFGIKPLYYFYNKNYFAFASELRALLEYGIEKKINQVALKTYLHLNYIPSPLSIIENVHKLKPGCFIKIEADATISIREYYKPEINYSTALNYSDAVKKLRALVEQSVEDRLVSDVPLGTFLSGGIDSSIITACAAKKIKNLSTFSVGYKDEPYFDETEFANLVAKQYKTNHTVFSLSNNDLFENLHSFLDSIDEPFADSSALAVYMLTKKTRASVKVSLSGDGADEIFGGYNKHEAELKSRKNNFINGVIKNLNPLLRTLPKSRNGSFTNRIRQAYKYSSGLQLSMQERYWQWAGFSNELEINHCLQHNSDYSEIKNAYLQNISADFNSFLLTDTKLVLENDMLVKADRMSMANSLEVRVPFLSHTLVDFAFTLPVEYKIMEGNRKRILKDAFYGDLQPEIFNRKKHGFEVPLLKWFQTELKSHITNECFNKELIESQDLFTSTYIHSLQEEIFSSNPNDAVAKTWAIIVFQHWWKKNILQ
ncbi:MAG: asparagine synthase (glutamine-hydrolyzing) [Bacteroidetes bacterium]|nr:asparagine synthase (glutamine-hydrolyzing) [Bacteroidota bacterium]